METVSTITPATAAPEGSQVESSDEEDEGTSTKYARLPLFITSDQLDRALLVNPEETDPEKFQLTAIPANFNPETHRLRRRDFQDETHYAEMRCDKKEKDATLALQEVKEERAKIEALRKLPLDQRSAVMEYQKGRAKMAKLEAQLRAMGLPIDA